MSGYLGEPEKMLHIWQPENSAPFEYGPIMRRLTNSLIQGIVDAERRSVAIRRLCETAAVSDSIECRTSLAQIAGIPFYELNIYKYAVGKIVGEQDPDLLRQVLDMAQVAISIEDNDRYDLLTASVGYYPLPPERLIIE